MRELLEKRILVKYDNGRGLTCLRANTPGNRKLRKELEDCKITVEEYLQALTDGELITAFESQCLEQTHS